MYFDNIYLYLSYHATERGGDKPFLATPGRPPLMFKDIRGEVWRMHARLTLFGVLPGERVMAQVEKSAEAVVLYLACLAAGAIYIPLNTAYTARELEYFIKDAMPRLFVCRPQDEKKLRELVKSIDETHTALRPGSRGEDERDYRGGITPMVCRSLGDRGDGTLFEHTYGIDYMPSTVNRTPHHAAAILYTSGTTGRPKGAMLTHANLQSNVDALHECWQWKSADVLLHALPLFHVHGLFVALHCAMLGGSTVHLLPKFDVAAVIEALPQSTVMMGVPTFYTRLLADEKFTKDTCADMRLFVAGSAPLREETHRLFEQRTGHRILERYGMTEAGMITSNPYHGERVAGTVGYALPGVEVRVADDENKPKAAGEVGVLQTRGPNVFKGYWQMEEKTTADFTADGWFITGDIATMDDDGRVSIVGRAKDLIISGGYNVYPKEIELAIDALRGVKESAVIGAPHGDFGEGVVAVVVAADDMTAADITRGLTAKLARFKQPKKVFLVDDLPRNAMGKVQKAVLRETYKDCFAD